jgi:hypothetical protein
VILAGTLIMHCRRCHCGVQLIIVSPPPLTLRLKFEIEIEFTNLIYASLCHPKYKLVGQIPSPNRLND